ncbi:MAG: CBS domain-containing protein, partial [Chloroflexota bacterium]|nr:CBS domain-containing protein [Chloroflexota bacterium]
ISTGDLITAGVLPMRRGLIRTALALDSASAEIVGTPLEQARQSSRVARDIMNKDVRSIAPGQSIREAARLMLETGLRRLPVVEADGTLVGILGRADLLQVIVTSPLMNQDRSGGARPLERAQQVSDIPAQQQPVANYVTRDVTTVGEQAPIADVIDALIISPFKRVIVVDEARRVRGIISDVDVLARMQEEVRPRLLTMLAGWARGTAGRLPTGALRAPQGKARVAADIMNREVVTVPETTPVQETIEHMMVTRRKALPVVDAQERLVGVVGRSDLLQILL